MKRKVSMFLSVILLVLLFPLNVFADSSNLDTPVHEEPVYRWNYTSYIWAVTAFDGSIGYTDACIDAYFPITQTTVDAVVYRRSGLSWVYVTEKHVVKNLCSASLEVEWNATIGTLYKTELVFTATYNGDVETIYRTEYGTYTG